jgi:hypothetical protein
LDEDKFDCDHFIEIPHKNDLNLGQQLVFEFAEQHLPDELGLVQRIFNKRGAYGRFKAFWTTGTSCRAGMIFENQKDEEALREWARENKIELEP